MNKRIFAFVALFALATSVVFAVGRSQSLSKHGVSTGVRLSTATADYRTGLAAAEAFTSVQSAGALAIPNISCGNFETVSVPVSFSNANATVVLTCARYHYDGTTYTFTGSERRTITAGDTLTTNGRFLGTLDADFPTRGASVVKIFLHAAPSAGSVTLGPPAVY